MNPSMEAAERTANDQWLFGYGSLIWKADFDFVERLPATITGWQRRFWQGSHDHRGTPEAPGRVVTLIEIADAICDGMAYRIAADQVPVVFDHLDYREKNGYERHTTEMALADGRTQDALLYVATPDNFAHLGSASDEVIAAQIHASTGPSGANRDYLLKLHQALVEMGTEDRHVARLFDLVSAMR